METNFRKVQLIKRFINLNLFYSIRIGAGDIVFQGHATSATLAYLKQWFDIKFDGKFLTANRGNIEIVLTIPE